MQKTYPLEWLDLLITLTLNPEKTDISAITGEQSAIIRQRIRKENLQLQSFIRNQVFLMTREDEIELLVRQYHSSLIALLDRTLENQKNAAFRRSDLKEVIKDVISCLDELLSFVEARFPAYLSLSERVPPTYLSISKKELRRKLVKVQVKIKSLSPDKEVADIVLNHLYQFVNSNQYFYGITFRDVLYQKELVKGLEEMETNSLHVTEYSALDELLIYLNFNSKAYTNSFTRRVARKINSCESLPEKIDRLLLYHKGFRQMHRKPGVILNPKYYSLETVLGNWFVQEIFYLEQKLRLSVIPLQGKAEQIRSGPVPVKQKAKVLCMLSSDQIGLILRAAEDLEILVAKSMNELFKTIVPHLSTPYKEDLSYDGMRSKSYAAEERDKRIVIETLERIVDKIKKY